METHDNDQYITFPLSEVDDAIQENIISHEEICEPVDECVLQGEFTEVSVPDVDNEITETEAAVEILTEHSDNDDENSVVYPIYIKEEKPPHYTSGDDESMAVEALRQLGGMYPCLEDKKVTCPNCANHFTQNEMVKHQSKCPSVKLSCTTCGEKFERKMDLNNHLVCHQVDRPHACRICGNLFRSKSSLQSHMLQVHRLERPHKCTICGADFQRPSSLSNHMKIHTYVAGRAIMRTQGNNTSQSSELFKKWPQNNPAESQTVSASTSSIQNAQNYDVCQVNWAAPSYNFHNYTISNNQEKIDSLPEFDVISNAEVTQFDYTESNDVSNQIGQEYNLTLNSFNNSDGIVKVETLNYNTESRKELTEEGTNNSTTHTCSHCGISFSHVTALTTHEKTHSSKNWDVPIECEYCDKQFQDSNHLANHQTTCAKKIMQNNIEQGVSNSKWGKHACSECGKKFTTKQKMFRHQWIHRKKTHSCEVCGTQFEKQTELDEHRLSAHPGDSPFTCTECGKSFVSRQGLWEHGRTHAGSPAHFHCDTCSKTFSSRQGYLIHHRTHTGERPYGCKFCWKSFRDGGTLRKHERIHTGERPHVCPLCSRAFNQKVVLREHVRWVHAAGKNETDVTGPPFPCPLCGSMNQDRDELCAHIVKHSDQMIAEAKAKTSNRTSKSKSGKKKSKSSLNRTWQSKQNMKNHSRLEDNEILLSITATENEGCSTQQNDSLYLVTTQRNNDSLHLISEMKSDDEELITEAKDDEDIESTTNHCDSLLKNEHIVEIGSTKSTNHCLRPLPTRHGDVTMRLITSIKENTLHLISKQNQSLPVLAIPNPEEHESFSSQIAQMDEIDVPMDVVTHRIIKPDDIIEQDETGDTLIHEVSSQPTVIQVVQYQESESENEELVCGICGEDFDDKHLLMEHIKVHINQ